MEKQKENFSLSLGGLSAYVNQLDPALVLEGLFETKSTKLFKKYLTNTGTNKLNVLNTTTYIQDGNTCSLTESGSTAFVQQTLTAMPINVTKKYCGKDFFNYWQSQFMTNTLDGSEIAFEKEIMDAELKRIAKINEKAIWQSVDGGATANLDKFDGLIKVLSGQSCVDITTTTVASGVTVSSISTIIDEMMDNVNSDILGEELYLFMSISNYNKAIRAFSTSLTSNPLFVKETANYEFKHPIYSNLTIVGVDGLAGVNHFVLTTLDNIYMAVPKSGDDLQVSWTQGAGADKNWYLIVDYIMGVQVGRPEYVVTNFTTA